MSKALIVTWPWKHISNLVRSPNFEVCYISSSHHVLSTDATKVLVSAFVLPRLDCCSFLLSDCPRCLSLKQTTKCSEQRCSFCSVNSQNWPDLSSVCFSPLAAHRFTNTYKIAALCYMAVLPLLDRSCLHDSSLQTSQPATQFFWYFQPLSSLCEHTLGWLEIYLFLMLHRLSGTLSLAK